MEKIAVVKDLEELQSKQLSPTLECSWYAGIWWLRFNALTSTRLPIMQLKRLTCDPVS